MIGLKTRFGQIGLAISPDGLYRLELPAKGRVRCADRPGTRLEKQVVRELADYFAEKRREFSFPIDLSGKSCFCRKVLAACLAIPFGTVASYRDLARIAGHPKSARAVGRVMATNPIPIVIPCHRVVGSDGALCGYRGGLKLKKALLQHEGIAVR